MPENFQDANYRPEGNKLGIGVHPFTVVFAFEGSKIGKFHFRIVNKEGDGPGLLTLGMNDE